MTAIPCSDGRFFIPEVETTYKTLPPIEVSQKLSLRCNALLLQNESNCCIVLDNGFTLQPGQSHTYNSGSDLGICRVEVYIRFEESTATASPVVKRLEVVEIQTRLTGRGHYVDNKSF